MHVNGRWFEQNEIPADRASIGSFISLRDSSEAAVRDIIETAAEAQHDPLAKKIGDLYASFMAVGSKITAGDD